MYKGQELEKDRKWPTLAATESLVRRERKKAERPAVTEGWGGEGPEEELKPSERLEIILDYEAMRNNLIVDFVVVVVELKHDMRFGSVLLQDDGKVGGSLGVGRL